MAKEAALKETVQLDKVLRFAFVGWRRCAAVFAVVAPRFESILEGLEAVFPRLKALAARDDRQAGSMS
jgi:hypothetical protein